MEATSSIPTSEVFGVDFFRGDLESAATAVIGRARSGEGGYACLCNVHVLMTGQRDESVEHALRDAWMVFPDGAPVAWLQRRNGGAGARRVAGADLMSLVFERGQDLGVRHFLFGSTPQVLAELQRRMRERYPRASIAGSYAPGFGRIEDHAVERIHEARPDLVWCALGAPKQELWMSEHTRAIGSSLVLGVGAAFDFLAEMKPRAPGWMQDHGLEWFHRLASEPRRLAGRYFVTNSRFLVKTAGELARRRVR